MQLKSNVSFTEAKQNAANYFHLHSNLSAAPDASKLALLPGKVIGLKLRQWLKSRANLNVTVSKSVASDCCAVRYSC